MSNQNLKKMEQTGCQASRSTPSDHPLTTPTLHSEDPRNEISVFSATC